MSVGMFSSAVSKEVGWDTPANEIPYPKDMAAVNRANAFWLLTWHRFLRSPETEEEMALIKRVTERLWP